MLRRDFGRYSLGALGASFLGKLRAAGRNTSPEFAHVTGITDLFGRFITTSKYGQIPAPVIELGKKSILDGLGLALAGSRGITGRLSRQYVKELGISAGGSVVIGTGERSSPQFAAFLNGISIHADDFDDTQLSAEKDRVYGLLTHPTVSVLAAALALLGRKRASGQELMLAYHVGVEVECKIAEAISPRSYEDGFHSTGTCGPFGAAASCAKLLHFDLSSTLALLGLVASQSAGLRQNFGTMTKPFHAGHASQIGVLSADLVALGWTASPGILEGDQGFFRAYGGSFDPGAIVGRLGNPWTFASPGVSLKPYPSGAVTHPAMTELMRLIEANDIRADQVEKVDVGVNRYTATTLSYHEPKTGLEAKFSMEFCVAVLLLEHKAGLGEFTDATVGRSDVQAMIRKVNFYVDPDADRAGYDKISSVVQIHLIGGRIIKGQVDYAKGSPANPMTFEDVATKFRGCAEYARWPESKTERIIAVVKDFENVSDTDTLLDLLVTEPA